MKIALYSDLHLELYPEEDAWEPPALDADLVILVGDIDAGTHGIEWAARAFRQQQSKPEIIYVPGNHEFYGLNFRETLDEMRKTAAMMDIHLLDNDAVEIAGVRVLGATLWSDFELYDKREASMFIAQHCISDYSVIFGDDRRFIRPSDTIRLHNESRAFLENELSKPFDGKTIVATHFAPHLECIESRFEGAEFTPFFTIDMAPLMKKYPIDLWAFGHTHFNVDFVDSGCRVISNQRGYSHEQVEDFRDNLVIEI